MEQTENLGGGAHAPGAPLVPTPMNKLFMTHLANPTWFNLTHSDDAITVTETIIASSSCAQIKTLMVS